MIKKYLDFIKESMDLILESDVVYSDKFRLALSKIENPISKSLLGIENKDLDVRSNYFDLLMDKNDTVSFIPDRRAQQILNDRKETVRFVGRNGGWLTYNKNEAGEYKNKKLFDELGFTPTTEEIVQPEENEIGEVIKKVVSEKSNKTFAWVKFTNTDLVINVEKLRAVDETTKLVWSTNRQEIRIGRAIRALLGSADIKFADKEIEDFVNLYKATIDKFNDKFTLFEEITGDKIGYWYSYRNYYNRNGTLGSSCMSDVNEDYFDIYMSNPEVCTLVIFKSEDDPTKIIGRALLWKLRDGKKFMDRIYTTKDSDVQLFRDYAKENGWYTKRTNGSAGSGAVVSPDGSNVNLDLTVDIKPGTYEGYPYLDTLKFWNKSGTLSINNSSGAYVLESTGGDYISCDSCDGSGRRSCYECDGDGSYTCSNCDGDGTVGKGDDKEDCPRCDGDGTRECDDCGGSGVTDCPECT